MKFLTLFLKLILIVLGLMVLLLCTLGFPDLFEKLKIIYPHYFLEQSLFIAGLYASAILFYFASINAYRILNLIDHHTAFSTTALNAIIKVKKAVFGMGVCYMFLLPFIYRVAIIEQAPGLVLMMGAIVAIPYILATFAAILERLLKEAIQLKPVH
ncbi:MAG: DUF2975 domain-containing protein [Lentilactobacillus diolivorans]|jgi:hypothetical protein|nr:DUF2975 domain-containing protein [Lentilactobacillus diolivorans]RRG01898.1 MAG: DUF2975 domain-containing protein [Lactobacillus sp.]